MPHFQAPVGVLPCESGIDACCTFSTFGQFVGTAGCPRLGMPTCVIVSRDASLMTYNRACDSIMLGRPRSHWPVGYRITIMPEEVLWGGVPE